MAFQVWTHRDKSLHEEDNIISHIEINMLHNAVILFLVKSMVSWTTSICWFKDIIGYKKQLVIHKILRMEDWFATVRVAREHDDLPVRADNFADNDRGLWKWV